MRADKKREPQNEKKTTAKTDMKRVTSSLMILAKVLVYKPVNLKKKLKRRITSFLPSTYLFRWDRFISIPNKAKTIAEAESEKIGAVLFLAGQSKKIGRVSTSRNAKLNMFFCGGQYESGSSTTSKGPLGVGEGGSEYPEYH